MMTKERTKTNINHPRNLKTSIEIQFGIKDKSLPTKKEIKTWILAAATKDIKVTIRIIGESEGRKLNYFFRGKKNATNVLSFPPKIFLIFFLIRIVKKKLKICSINVKFLFLFLSPNFSVI